MKVLSGVLVLAGEILLQACDMVIRGVAIEPTDLSTLQRGLTRDEVEKVLDDPEPLGVGNTVLYEYDTGSDVYVDIRASEAAGAPVVERWKLYGASHALVIGIDNYSAGWPRLSNAVKDARLVAQALEARGFEVTLLTDVPGQQLREQLRRFFAFKGADPDARLFVWFAGHGYSKLGEGYLVPADAPSPDRPEFVYSALHIGDVGSMVRIAQSKHVLAVFDSCFAGTIFSSQRARPPAAITAAVKRPVRQFLTSGDADQKVSDDGTYRTLFLRALQGEETADANRDGYLTATELSFYLEDRVTKLTRGLQTPRGGKLRDPKFDQGDFVFLLPSQAPHTATAPQAADPTQTFTEPGEATLDLTFWNLIKDTDRAEDYRVYLKAFPDGKFAELARARIKTHEHKNSEQRPQTKVTNLPPSQAALTAKALRLITSNSSTPDQGH
ncbi:MAG: caspase family protein [Nitrospira sp.]|nr:caspase family protein [Nitrospira sp.]